MIIEVGSQKETRSEESRNHAAGMSYAILMVDTIPSTQEQKDTYSVERSIKQWKGMKWHLKITDYRLKIRKANESFLTFG